MAKPVPDSKSYEVLHENPLNLSKSKKASTLTQHHKQVALFHQPRIQKMIVCFSYVQGEQFTQLQLQRMQRSNKAPIVFDYIKTSQRTVLGLFTGNKFDTAISPTEPNDGKVSEMLDNWYSDVVYHGDFQKHDIESLMNAWACGQGWVECYLHMVPGKRPLIQCQTLNPLTIYPDPNSVDVGTRSDMMFVDRVLWMTKEDLELTFHKKDFSCLDAITAAAYTQTDPSTNIDHETMDQKNNSFKVIERMYRVRVPQYFKFDEDLNRVGVSPEDHKAATPEEREDIFNEPVEMLYTAIACPAYNSASGDPGYLFNGEYYTQPRDARSQRIIFPIQEVVAESTNGKPNGFVEYMISPQNLVNAAMTQLYHAMQHGSAASYGIDKSKFIDDDEAKRAAKDFTKADEAFLLKEDAKISDAMQPIPRPQSTTNDNPMVYNNALNALREISSTPLSLQGQSDTTTTSGIQNQQKIVMATTMLAGVIGNSKDFQKRRCSLMLAYLQDNAELFADQIISVQPDSRNPNKPKYITLMETVPEMDEAGEWTGAMAMLNDPRTYEFDIRITESTFSPTNRASLQTQISQLFQMGVAQTDPGMAAFLAVLFVKSLDIPEGDKQQIISHAQFIQQKQQQDAAAQQQQGQLDQQGQMMDNMSKADALTTQSAHNQAAVEGGPTTSTPGGTPQGASGAPLPKVPTPIRPDIGQ